MTCYWFLKMRYILHKQARHELNYFKRQDENSGPMQGVSKS
jgi:hypothetical protein